MKRTLIPAATGVVALVVLHEAGIRSSLFTANYLPHRYCYLAQPWLVWTNVATDLLIAGSYGVIFACLVWITQKLSHFRTIHEYLWVLMAFGAFIAACGMTHIMEVVTIWWPVYPLSVLVKGVCAAASLFTAVVLARVSAVLVTNICRFLDMLVSSEDEKEQALRALIASEKLAAAGRVSASIAHEINNPLESANNLLYLLTQGEGLPDDALALLKNARVEVDRAINIAHDTLSFFREPTDPTPVSLSPLVQGVLDHQAADLMKRNIVLETRLRTPSQLMAHHGELRQILMNLIENAAAASGPDSRIIVRVQLRRASANVRSLRAPRDRGAGTIMKDERPVGYSITVADTGSGIKVENRSELFNLFFTTKGDKGNGLGLWLVRSMVEKLGGRIVCRSRTASESKKAGTIFNIWIPLEPVPISAVDCMKYPPSP